MEKYWSDDNAKKTGDRKWHWFGDEPVERFKLFVRGNGHSLTATETGRVGDASASTTVVALHGKFHEAFEQSGFILTKPTELHIAAEGEAREDGEFDFGSIINADTRATAWRFTWRDSQPAGGAPKNRQVHTSLLLPAGRYAAFYADRRFTRPIRMERPAAARSGRVGTDGERDRSRRSGRCSDLPLRARPTERDHRRVDERG